LPGAVSHRDALGDTLVELAETDPRIVALTGDVSRSVGLLKFRDRFPQRFINAGISEMNMIGMAAGLSTVGYVPVCSAFAMFAVGRAFEIIRNGVAYPRLNVKIAATHAGINVGMDGGTHQAVEDVALMRSLPNMVVLVPTDATEVRLALRAAIAHQGPVYVRLGRDKVPPVYAEEYDFCIGKAVRLREGSDATIITMGLMVPRAMEAAGILALDGIEVRVVNMHTVKPIDEEEVLSAATETGGLVVVEEHLPIGGLGSAVAELLVRSSPKRMVHLALPDRYAESGTPKDLFEKYEFTPGAIAEAVRRSLQKKG